jgi:hypothetical protein
MTDCVLFSKEDYDSILSHLKSIQIECENSQAINLSGRRNNSYHICEIERHIEAIEALLKKEGL